MSTSYCTNCGVKVKEVVEEQERQHDREELQQIEAQIRRESHQIEDLQRLSRRIILPTTFSKDRALYNDFSEPMGCIVSGSIMLLMMLGVLIAGLSENLLIVVASLVFGVGLMILSLILLHLLYVRPRINKRIQERRNIVARLASQATAIKTRGRVET